MDEIIREFEERPFPYLTRTDARAYLFRELRLQGMSVTDIGQKHGLGASAVSMMISRFEKKYSLPGTSGRKKDKTEKPKTVRTSHRKEEKTTQLKTTDERGIKFRTLKLQGATLEEIAGLYNLTRERVRQIITTYEKKNNLPSSTQTARQIRKKAREADLQEFEEEQRLEKQKNLKRFVPCFQLDAHLVGRFLRDLGRKSVLYGFFGKSQRNPRSRKDGTPFPSMNEPTNIFISNYAGRRHVTVHSWVLTQYGITIEQREHCHHKDGDVTNNMRENLEVLSNAAHGRITMREQIKRGTIKGRGHHLRQKVFTDQQVEEIRAQYQPGIMSIPRLAKVYGTSPGTMHNAVHGLGAYRNVSPSTRHALNRSSLVRSLTISQVEEIRAQYQPGVTSFDALADRYSVSKNTIYKALYGQAGYSDINPATRHSKRKPTATLKRPSHQKQPAPSAQLSLWPITEL